MSNFREVFESEHVILPVVHVQSEEQAIRNVSIVQEAGCDGAFLIGMQGRGHKKLFNIYDAVYKAHKGFWIGLNCLGISTYSVFSEVPTTVDGIWVDNAGITENPKRQPAADVIKDKREESGWKGLYFGGVAHKGQLEPVWDYELVARAASAFMDVITTSGLATGLPPDIEKIRKMKIGAGSTPLAIASGISSENVGDYLKIDDCFLVASSLLIPGTDDFNPQKVKSLVKAVRG